MRQLKLFLIVIAIVLLIVVGVGVGGFIYANQLIVIGVEKAGTQSLGYKTTLEEADLSILDGSLTLKGLHIANPEGFTIENLMRLEDVSTAVDLGSLRSDTIKVKTIRVYRPVITLEQKGMISNIQVVLDTLKEMQQQKEKPAPTEEEQVSQKHVLVERIEIIEPIAKLKLLPGPNVITERNVELGDIVLTNIGNQTDKGAMMSTVFQKVLLSMAGAIVKSGVDLPGNLLKGLEGSIVGVAEAVGVTLEGVIVGGESILKGAGKTLEGTLKIGQDILGAPGNLINPDKRKKDPCEPSGAQTLIEGLGGILEGGSKAVEGAGKGISELGKVPGKSIDATREEDERKLKKKDAAKDNDKNDK